MCASICVCNMYSAQGGAEQAAARWPALEQPCEVALNKQPSKRNLPISPKYHILTRCAVSVGALGILPWFCRFSWLWISRKCATLACPQTRTDSAVFRSSGLKDGFCPGSAVFPGCGFLHFGLPASVQILPSSLVLPFCLAVDFWKVCRLGLLHLCRFCLHPWFCRFAWLWISGKSAALDCCICADSAFIPGSAVLPFCLAMSLWKVCPTGAPCLPRQSGRRPK